MQFLNHYSAPILAAILLAGGLSLLWRRGGKMRHWLILGGTMVVLGVAWMVFRPVASPAAAPVAGQAMLLEVQSPYCLGCVAMKPVVDRLEKELRGKLVVRRVDIQSDEGGKLASQYGIELTPTFIFFDTAGKEQWRNVGQLDVLRVRTSLQPLANGVGNRPPGREPTAGTLGRLLAEVNARTPQFRGVLPQRSTRTREQNGSTTHTPPT